MPLFPRRMMPRLALILVAALAIEFAGNALLSRLQEREVVSGERIRRYAEQLASADQVAEHVAPTRRPALMADMAISGMTLNWVPATVITDASGGHAQLARLRARLDEAAAGLAGRDLRLSLIPSEDGRQRDLLGALRVSDGSFITFRIRPFLAASPSFALIALLHLALVAIVLGVALAMTWTLVRPLGQLAAMADATGRDRRSDFPIRGPWEVRRVAAAFRDMQARLFRTMDDHTQALVAVSHDLRTPIQRMRLRSALLADREARDGMALDLQDMETFIGSITDFIQSGLEEQARMIDLSAMAMSIVDNVADAGFDVVYEGPDSFPVRLKPLTMKRALANLVDNACRHGDRVRVELRLSDAVTLSVEDDGPGIPPALRESAFQPFQRDLSGGRAGGCGLGLAIVKNAAAALGAEVTLAESELGGLAARIVLPRQPGPSSPTAP